MVQLLDGKERATIMCSIAMVAEIVFFNPGKNVETFSELVTEVECVLKKKKFKPIQPHYL